MFTAILFVCSMIKQEGCFMLVDNRGPYETKERCNARIVEMSKDAVDDVLPSRFFIASMKCTSKQLKQKGTPT